MGHASVNVLANGKASTGSRLSTNVDHFLRSNWGARTLSGRSCESPAVVLFGFALSLPTLAKKASAFIQQKEGWTMQQGEEEVVTGSNVRIPSGPQRFLKIAPAEGKHRRLPHVRPATAPQPKKHAAPLP